jgi:DNA-binding NtrC family response regulator
MKIKVLVVDDEGVQREMLGGYLMKKGYEVTPVSSGKEALEVIGERTIDIMITDHKMPGMSGMELAALVNSQHPNISVIMLTAHGSIDDAVRAMKDGVEDYLTKPVNLEELDIILQRIVDKRHLIRENRELRKKTVSIPHIKGIVYVSPVMEEVMSRAVRAAASTATVLISGESGTGKELVAQSIHYLSERNAKPFVPVNCSAIPENLIESELFGHEKGSFTGADQRRIGRFEQADGGTLFLDEIGDLPLAAQVKLLRVLQERTFERVGSNQTIHVDVRVISATNRNLENEISAGRFRQDLYYRLHVIGIELPPVRDRKIDIPPLVDYFRKLYADQHEKTIRAVSTEALDTLVKYSFPGNIRELSNIIEQAVVLTRNDIITIKDLPTSVMPSAVSDEHSGSLDDQVEALERNALTNALRQTGGNKSATARLLGVSERKIRYLVQKYGDTSF